MKQFMFTLAFAALTLVSGPAFANHHPAGETITVSANGLICDFCARALEKVFKEREEVSGISVDLTKKTIVIDTTTARAIDDATVTKLVTDAGYTVTGITRAQSMRHEDAAAALESDTTGQPAADHDTHEDEAHDHGDDHGEDHGHGHAAPDGTAHE